MINQIETSKDGAALKKTTPAAAGQQKSKRDKQPYVWGAEKFDPVRSEKALWKAVITQSMMDALSRSSKPEEQFHKHEAIRWLTTNQKDFITVCHLAGEDPEYIRKQALQAMRAPRLWRAEAGKGARYEERREYRRRLKTVVKENTRHASVTIQIRYESISA